ncbi:hypothetical protein AK830_g10520 [Neonectria ditissima]|uniref:Uncharacterized protein n=1 Tax=Neonectria ditissima TaxID=78410 RepID=A0A0P7ATD8_9HYPO|nr:hypothetical protein AK830_g10520 [Neonectria ditissima]
MKNTSPSSSGNLSASSATESAVSGDNTMGTEQNTGGDSGCVQFSSYVGLISLNACLGLSLQAPGSLY